MRLITNIDLIGRTERIKKKKKKKCKKLDKY